jgi:DNA polymerase III sliding clamp (beta) subunit (PCNA family)
VIYDVQFPPVGPLFAYEYEGSVQVDKAEFLEKLNRACQYAGAERNPVLRTFWGKGGISIMMENSEIGMIGDTIDCHGQLNHGRIEILFSPKILSDAVSHSPESKIKIMYDITETDPRISKHIKVDGGAGYECIVMKRQHAQPTGV